MWSIASASVSMVITASLCSATSSGEPTSFAPASVTGFALSGERFHTVSVWPTSISRSAIAAPMRPRPAIPICISALRCVRLGPAAHKTRAGDIMSEAKPKGQVGIVGLGIMGGAIAKNLSAAGWQVIGHDIVKDRCEEAKAAGVTIAKSAADVAKAATNIFISLPKPAALHATVEEIAAAK